MFDQIFDAIEEWMRGLLTGIIHSNLDRMFTDVNEKTSEIAVQVGQTPQGWNSSIFSMIENLSETVILPIAGIIITFVLCYELISMITEKNNMHDVDTATVEFNGKTYTDTKDLADIPATGHSYDNGKCTVCGAIASDFKVIITAGANGSWQKGTKDGLTFTSNAAYKHFQKVQVDGKDLDASNYTVKEGSTIVTLKTSYLETLSVGKHTLAIVSATGTATTEFTIKAAASANDRNPANPNGEATESVQTGDNTNMMLWIVMLFVSASILGIAVYEKRKKHMEN